MRSVFSQFDQYVKLNKKIPPEILTSLMAIDEPGRLADSIAANLTLKLSEKQKNDLKEVIIKSKGNPDEIRKKIEEEFGFNFVE